jgi:hypothetical protein
MMEQRPGSGWVQNLLRPALVAGMLVCLLSPVVEILEWWLPGWNGTPFLVFAFFAGLEGILSERALRQRRIIGWGYLVSRAAEILLLLLLLRLLRYVLLGWDQLWADALRWPRDLGLLFDEPFLYTCLVFVPMWLGALQMSRLLSQLDVGKGKGPPPEDRTSIEYYLWLTSPSPVGERRAGLEQLAAFYLWGGIALLLASAAIYGLLPSVRIPAIPILLYFVMGLALLSQGHFSVLHASWETQEVSIQPGIARRWLPWAVVFGVGVALVAWLLPTRYLADPIHALLALIGLIVALLYQGVLFVVGLVVLLLYYLLSPLFPEMEAPEPPRLEPIEPMARELVGEGGPATVPEVLLTSLFWIAILAIVGYALYRFVRDRLGPVFESEEAEDTRWGRLVAWLRDLWRRWRGWRREVGAQLQARRAQRRAERMARIRPPRFLSLRRLSPRELVRYFYLSTERRAAQAGRPRRRDQTPYEYEAELDESFPDLEEDLSGLTEAFVAARYDRRPVGKGDADAVKPLWQRIKAALRRRRSRPDRLS